MKPLRLSLEVPAVQEAVRHDTEMGLPKKCVCEASMLGKYDSIGRGKAIDCWATICDVFLSATQMLIIHGETLQMFLVDRNFVFSMSHS